MSFWDSVKKLAQPYDDDEEYEEDEELDEFEVEEEPVERPVRQRRTPPFASASSESAFASTAPAAAATPRAAASASSAPASGFSGNVLHSNNGKQEVVLCHLDSFADTSSAADQLRSNKAVILNMENVDKAMARRVVDFLSGCAYALDGKVKKIAQSTYLFCPRNMEVSGDLENLQGEAESYL